MGREFKIKMAVREGILNFYPDGCHFPPSKMQIAIYASQATFNQKNILCQFWVYDIWLCYSGSNFSAGKLCLKLSEKLHQRAKVRITSLVKNLSKELSTSFRVSSFNCWRHCQSLCQAKGAFVVRCKFNNRASARYARCHSNQRLIHQKNCASVRPRSARPSCTYFLPTPSVSPRTERPCSASTRLKATAGWEWKEACVCNRCSTAPHPAA